MMDIVIDTNVLVAGLLSPFGACGEIVRMVSAGELELSIDARILTEYNEVLRPKSTTNFQQIEERQSFADNLHSPQCTKIIIIYAVNSIIIKCWRWIMDRLHDSFDLP